MDSAVVCTISSIRSCCSSDSCSSAVTSGVNTNEIPRTRYVICRSRCSCYASNIAGSRSRVVESTLVTRAPALTRFLTMGRPENSAVRRPARLDPAALELSNAVGLGAVVALIVLVVFPDLVMAVLSLIAEVIGRATRPG